MKFTMCQMVKVSDHEDAAYTMKITFEDGKEYEVDVHPGSKSIGLWHGGHGSWAPIKEGKLFDIIKQFYNGGRPYGDMTFEEYIDKLGIELTH